MTPDAPTDRIRVLIADDQELVRYGLRLVLEAEDDVHVVGEAADGASAVEAAIALTPDVILMDVRMPGIDGIRATQDLAARLPRTRVLVLTTYDLDEFAFGALQAGAAGFLLKNTRPAELVAAIRTVATPHHREAHRGRPAAPRATGRRGPGGRALGADRAGT